MGWWDQAREAWSLSGDTLLAFVDASKAGLVRSSLLPEEVISGKEQYDGGCGGWQTLGLFLSVAPVEALGKPRKTTSPG